MRVLVLFIEDEKRDLLKKNWYGLGIHRSKHWLEISDLKAALISIYLFIYLSIHSRFFWAF